MDPLVRTGSKLKLVTTLPYGWLNDELPFLNFKSFNTTTYEFIEATLLIIKSFIIYYVYSRLRFGDKDNNKFESIKLSLDYQVICLIDDNFFLFLHFMQRAVIFLNTSS